MFYSKLIKNKINYFEKQDMINQKKNPSTIIYRDSYDFNTNIPEKKIPPKTPSLYSQYKIYKVNNTNIKEPNSLLANYSIRINKDRNSHRLNSKNLESNSFSNKLIDFHDLNMNNRGMNFVQNNFKKVVKYTNQNNNSISIISDKDNVVHPFRLSGDNKHIMNNNNNPNNKTNNTIVNITYINENTNYIKNVYPKDLLKPQAQDKFILDNEKKIEHLSNDKRRTTPNEGFKIIKQSKMKVNTPNPNKIKNINNIIKDNKANNQIHEIKDFKKNENDYMKEIKNIMYNRNNNSKQNDNYLTKSNKISLPKDIVLQKDNHNLMNDINIAQKEKEENKSNISLNIKKIKEKLDDRDYQLNYKAKITESKYRKKIEENILINKNNNNQNNNTINTKESNYPKTPSKYKGPKITKSFFNSSNKINNPNNKLVTSSQTQLKENNNNNKDSKKINTPSKISKLTITNTSSTKQKAKTIKIKKEEKHNNNNNKINPFKYEEKEKENRKKTLEKIPLKFIRVKLNHVKKN